jgi:hypothetical protein
LLRGVAHDGVLVPAAQRHGAARRRAAEAGRGCGRGQVRQVAVAGAAVVGAPARRHARDAAQLRVVLGVEEARLKAEV